MPNSALSEWGCPFKFQNTPTRRQEIFILLTFIFKLSKVTKRLDWRIKTRKKTYYFRPNTKTKRLTTKKDLQLSTFNLLLKKTYDLQLSTFDFQLTTKKDFRLSTFDLKRLTTYYLLLKKTYD